MDRPIRPPPGARRAMFASSVHGSVHAPAPTSRRQNSNLNSRPDFSTPVYSQSREDELVERDASGHYMMFAPQGLYKHMALGMKTREDEETEQENQMIELYGKQNNHWDSAAILEEIKVALQSSLEKKVASLDDDKWMFEGEPIKSKK